MVAVLQEIVGILVAGITDLGQGIGAGLSAVAKAMFLTEGTGGALQLSTFGGLVCVFGGIALAVGLTRLIFQFVSSLGK